ncbi:hypothetical protein [Sphingomonas trueperi]|jgi:hypothetical protein|uniref:hypothetical protein n=1 Tax=Sphingomonas TaxID=13687 RepID=UPI000F23FB57
MTIKHIGSIGAMFAAAMIVSAPADAAPRHYGKKQVCKVEVRGHGHHKKRVRVCHWVRHR